ncbi:urease subunit gamma [Allobacillus sp. SKP8-2]|uniref:Urease subunit gamma n=1 Tax=Allobacillus saliphilus TaxID=2912308 RepID=A0A941HV11_9BACI|nr:urease subunit gamma [Allobacillus saliphilus]MBR7554949.1 urease subunit gamma [Allobacillus saliphilus]
MQLLPREKEKMMIVVVADLARRRKQRGLKKLHDEVNKKKKINRLLYLQAAELACRLCFFLEKELAEYESLRRYVNGFVA